MLSEFKDFIAKGNVMDLAVGVIIGGAFALITASLIGDIIMPIIGAIFGGLDFSNYFVGLSDNVTAPTLDAAKEQGAVLAYGNFISTIFNFIIIAFVIFMLVRWVNKVKAAAEAEKKAEEEAPAGPSEEVVLLTEIRDALAKK